jgi:hypothetical protein
MDPFIQKDSYLILELNMIIQVMIFLQLNLKHKNSI